MSEKKTLFATFESIFTNAQIVRKELKNLNKE